MLQRRPAQPADMPRFEAIGAEFPLINNARRRLEPGLTRSERPSAEPPSTDVRRRSRRGTRLEQLHWNGGTERSSCCRARLDRLGMLRPVCGSARAEAARARSRQPQQQTEVCGGARWDPSVRRGNRSSRQRCAAGRGGIRVFVAATAAAGRGVRRGVAAFNKPPGALPGHSCPNFCLGA
eukprot:364446-Chlamydomonas_euryale.AAC.12